MNAQVAKVFTIIGVVVAAVWVFDWWNHQHRTTSRPYSGSLGQTGVGAWAGSNTPAYQMTSATNDISVTGVPEETGSCPGSPSIMGASGGCSSGCSSEGCHCN
jgi:hypothetical protein